MNKRGLSGILTTILLIMIGIAAITIIWFSVNESLVESTQTISDYKIPMDIRIKSVKFDPSNNVMSVIVTKVLDNEKINISSLQVIIQDDYDSESFKVEVPGGFVDTVQEKFLLDLNDSDLYLEELKEITVIPVSYSNGQKVDHSSDSAQYDLEKKLVITQIENSTEEDGDDEGEGSDGGGEIPPPGEYSDLLLVTNANSADSIEISEYYYQTRGGMHRLNITTSTNDVISQSDFNAQIRQPIENYLTTNDLVDSINYIVLTKGFPLRTDNSGGCKSIDSKLTLILSANSANIENANGCSGPGGYTYNPMYNQNEKASKAHYDIYMVSRLDGYSVEEIKNAMGNSSIHQAQGDFLLDQQIASSIYIFYVFDNRFSSASNTLTSRGYSTILDESAIFRMNLDNLAGYYSFGSNDGSAPSDSSTWNLTFNPGSIGDTAVSTSARSFTTGTTYGQSLIADLIASGISYVKGYAYEPYASAISNPTIVFDRYTNNYTAGESMYMGSQYVNWMDVYVGDPKMKIYQ